KSVAWADDLGLFLAITAAGENRAFVSQDGFRWYPRYVFQQQYISVTSSDDLFYAVENNSQNKALVVEPLISVTKKAELIVNNTTMRNRDLIVGSETYDGVTIPVDWKGPSFQDIRLYVEKYNRIFCLNRDTDLMVGLIYYSDDAGLTWSAFDTPEGDFD